MGIDISEEAGWRRNKGLRLIGGGRASSCHWPELATSRDYGLVRTRVDFDEKLARHAQKAGARLLERCNVTEPILDDAPAGSPASRAMLDEEKTRVTFHAAVVLAADGNSTRLSLAMGLNKRDDRPLGVAVRTYFTCPARRRLHGVLAGAVGPAAAAGPAAARLRLGLRHGRRHRQRGPRHPELLEDFKAAGLARGPQGVDRRDARRVGLSHRKT